MKENRDKIYLERIMESISRIDDHLSGVDSDCFMRDLTIYDAVLMQLINIGEMINRLSNDFKEYHSEFPWHQIIGMRNRISHGYFDIDAKEVWKTAQEDLPALRKNIEELQ